MDLQKLRINRIEEIDWKKYKVSMEYWVEYIKTWENEITILSEAEKPKGN